LLPHRLRRWIVWAPRCGATAPSSEDVPGARGGNPSHSPLRSLKTLATSLPPYPLPARCKPRAGADTADGRKPVPHAPPRRPWDRWPRNRAGRFAHGRWPPRTSGRAPARPTGRNLPAVPAPTPEQPHGWPAPRHGRWDRTGPRAVVGCGDHLAIAHHHGADGHLSGLRAQAGLFQRQRHGFGKRPLSHAKGLARAPPSWQERAPAA
jgi:hypothetical protein